MDPQQSSSTQPDAEPPPTFTRVSKPPEPRVLALVSSSDTLYIRIQAASLHELLAMRRVAAKHGADIRTLRIAMDSVSAIKWWIELNDRLQFVDYRPIDWDALLAQMPRLNRLEVTEMALTSVHVVKIVEAASRHCNELEALVLPVYPGMHGVRDDLEPLLRVLVEAVKNWGARAERPGLSELTVPCYARSSSTFSSSELLRLVIANCPRLTALDIALCHVDGIHGGESSVDTVDDAFCEMLSRCCPNLARFTLRDVFMGQLATRIQTLTDDGLMTLSGLAFLTDLRLRQANFTGLCLFDFLNGLSSDHDAAKLFQITIGGPNSTDRLLKAFHVLMKRLEVTSSSDLRFAASDFLLRVTNGNVTDIKAATITEYLRTVEPLVQRVKAKHPSLRIRLTMRGMAPSPWSKWGHPRENVYHFWLHSSCSTRTPPQDWDWGFSKDPDNSFATLGGMRAGSVAVEEACLY